MEETSTANTQSVWAFVAAFVFILFSLYYFLDYLNFYPSAVPVNGTILKAISHTGRHDRFWTLLIEFDTPNQKKVQVIVHDNQLSADAYLVNDPISFYYNTKNPQDVRIAPPLGTLMHSVLFLLISLFSFFAGRSMKKDNKEEMKT